MMNAVGGTTLHYWAQSWRLNPWDFKVVSETTQALRRVARAEGIDGRRLAVRPRGARAVLRQGRIRDRRVGPGRQRQGHDRSDAATSSKAPRKRAYPMPPLRSTGFIDLMTAAARGLGWHPFPGPAAINSRTLSGPIGVHVSRLLQQGRLPRRRQERPERDDDSARAEDRAAESRDARARHVDRRRRPAARSPASPTSPTARSSSSRRRSCCSRATPTRTRGCCCSRSRRRFRTACRTITARSAATTSSHAQGGGVTALFPFNLNAWYGLPAQGVAVDNFADDNFDHGALDFIGGGNLWVYSDRRPIAAASMGTFGRDAELGHRSGRRSSSRTPTAPTPPTCRRRRCPTKTTFSISIRR